MMQKVVLAGNPNTGKTTLFNTLTGAKEHSGNWHGVTVDVKEKVFKHKTEEFVLCDLPGIYSLDSYSKEEQIAADYINQNKEAIFVCLTDANNLKRNLYLALELKEKVKNLIIAVNMANEVKSLNADKLSKELGATVVLIDARKKKSVLALKDVIYSLSRNLKNDFLKNDKVVSSSISKNVSFDIRKFEEKSRKRFEQIDIILKNADYNNNGFYGYGKLDKVLLNKFWGFVIFGLVMGLVFFITFGPFGSILSDIISWCFAWLSKEIMGLLATFISSEPVLRFIEEGVIGGALTIVSFLPQIIILFMCLNFLEDVGYLSRVAFMFDGIFKKIGLTGKSAFSLIMGFGCTTTAMITTRNLDNDNLRKRTGILLPFMSCSAKLPIYAVICSAFFKHHKALMVFALYMLAILLMLGFALILNLGNKNKQKDTFILEMPKYRLPSLTKILSDTLQTAKNFVIRVGGVLLLCSIVIYILYNFSFSFKYVALDTEQSILYKIASFISCVFAPLGFGSVGATVAILSGIVAKEMVVSSLSIINNVSASSLALSLTIGSSAVCFNKISAISFLIFILLYSPCVSTFVAMKKEINTKTAVLSFIFQFALAYFVSFCFYGSAFLILKGLWWIFFICLILVALILTFMVKYIRKKNKVYFKIKTDCGGCGLCKERACYGDNQL